MNKHKTISIIQVCNYNLRNYLSFLFFFLSLILVQLFFLTPFLFVWLILYFFVLYQYGSTFIFSSSFSFSSCFSFFLVYVLSIFCLQYSSLIRHFISSLSLSSSDFFLFYLLLAPSLSISRLSLPAIWLAVHPNLSATAGYLADCSR